MKKLSKKVISKSIEDRKKEQSTKVRVARKDGKYLGLSARPEGYELLVNPSTHEEFIFIANKLLEWGKLETSTNIDDFSYSQKISPYRFKRFDNEYFQECLEIVKYQIASRNRRALIEKQFNEKLYFEELPYLNRDVKEYREELLLKKLDIDQKGNAVYNIIDHMMDIPLENKENR